MRPAFANLLTLLSTLCSRVGGTLTSLASFVSWGSCILVLTVFLMIILMHAGLLCLKVYGEGWCLMLIT